MTPTCFRFRYMCPKDLAEKKTLTKNNLKKSIDSFKIELIKELIDK